MPEAHGVSTHSISTRQVSMNYQDVDSAGNITILKLCTESLDPSQQEPDKVSDCRPTVCA